jgi:hypothetical protein
LPANSSAICNLTSAILLSLVAAACGKKGPPLAPIIRVPAAVQGLAPQRVGNEVYLTVTIPSQNIDSSTPSAVRRVDIYAYTGLEEPGPRMMAAATLVASIPVAEVPLDRTGEPLPPMPKPGEALQGAVVTVRDVLSAVARTPRSLPPLARRGLAALPRPPEATPPLPQRFYTGIAVSPRGTSPAGIIVAVPLGPIPDPPASLLAEYTPQSIRLGWEPAGGLIGFLLDRELGPDVAPIDEPLVARIDAFGATANTPSAVTAGTPTPGGIASTEVAALGAPGSSGTTPGASSIAPDLLPPGPTRYNVYREMAPDPLELPEGPARGDWRAEVPAALNAAPLDVLTYEDPLLFDGRERCYHVRAVRGSVPVPVQSEATPRICVTPVDTEPPAAPAGLTAEAIDGAITLLWDPNVEEDLGGYLVLRGVPGDATLSQLTERPVPSARYVDRAVVPGTRYVYAVQAVDDRVPLGNVSAESNRVEETAR